MKNAFLKLPFVFSEKLLLEDLEVCTSHTFSPHYNTSDYIGSWKSIALRSLNGDPNQIYAHASGSEKFQNTPLLDACPYFKEIIDSFRCEKESIRLLNLSPNSKIKEHTDHNLGYEDGTFRIHIPITTNLDVHFYINDEKVSMQVGECWYGNFNLPHKVENNGAEDRIHLIMDCIRNEWSDQLFSTIGYDFEFEKRTVEYDQNTTLRMIEELERMNTEASKEILLSLRSRS
ncbi:aspartyl/asparaginyl beta-hydroxylase domain-containing protein [Aquimarina sp. SS2-1]|uniref:aspartyl/asparaginyl beta-hydroxylase domain-containing protein n=1 Tax=Aquimarina besae TaxID=3342247 RepID=UPI00366E6740